MSSFSPTLPRLEKISLSPGHAMIALTKYIREIKRKREKNKKKDKRKELKWKGEKSFEGNFFSENDDM